MKGVDIDKTHKQQAVTLRLPYPPSNNRYYRHGKGRTYISAEGVAYRNAGRIACLGCARLDGRLSMSIDIFPSRSASQDVDNVAKAILDALQHAGLYTNDSQIDDLHIVRREKVEKGVSAHVVVRVTERRPA